MRINVSVYYLNKNFVIFQELYSDVRHAMVGAVSEPMDTIFVRSVRVGGAGARAGLVPGDRLLAVAGQPVSGWPYAKVVQLIQQAPAVLVLHVVPKEADVLQRVRCFYLYIQCCRTYKPQGEDWPDEDLFSSLVLVVSNLFSLFAVLQRGSV